MIRNWGRKVADMTTTRRTRVEVVDSYHKDWPIALKLIDRHGQRERFGIADDGWLPARRSLLVAFVGDQPAGHLCFTVTPVVERTASALRTRLEAQVDGRAVEEGLANPHVSAKLERAARRRAIELKCETFRLDLIDGD
jgi:hypothetical protein